ncbi:hypothetical protein BpHYR1_040267 [Brachionus plicatilis]|uniref:Uncharacterized protein n=1 Tax=Brachionus plicatilis TaxID=10195 RepID=A0A3M7S286_BRAPC|nr:hypothetical protein BpHYR1_040267 [Brachionus plicatilis]
MNLFCRKPLRDCIKLEAKNFGMLLNQKRFLKNNNLCKKTKHKKLSNKVDLFGLIDYDLAFFFVISCPIPGQIKQCHCFIMIIWKILFKIDLKAFIKK